MSDSFGFPPADQKPYWFLCYDPRDTDRVAPIARSLNDIGISLWYDSDANAGKERVLTYIEQLHRASGMILLFTKNMLDPYDFSGFREYRAAAEMLGLKCLCIFLDRIALQDVPFTKYRWWLTVQANSIEAYEIRDTRVFARHAAECLGIEIYGEKEIEPKPVPSGKTQMTRMERYKEFH